MRLLNAATLEFQEYSRDDVPPYYILSHRWGTDEVSYKDFKKGRNRDSEGTAKIMGFRTIAIQNHRTDSLAGNATWIWSDTACIDRRQSAELTEAVNSMYDYYRKAYACYVHLSDVWFRTAEYAQYARNSPEMADKIAFGQIRRSTWFSRGWTLQELLAPRKVVFYDRHWQIIGHKCGSHCDCEGNGYGRLGPNLNLLISEITGIDESYLIRPSLVKSASIARRMSWASKRQTSRVEDEAYCLMGILGVNMQLLYGEGGDMAFRRLQEEIIRRSTDMSIFAWISAPPDSANPRLLASGILAARPEDFKYSGDVEQATEPCEIYPYTITNAGLDLRGRAQRSYIKLADQRKMEVWILPLNCVCRRPLMGSMPASLKTPPFTPVELILASSPVRHNVHGPKLMDRIDFGGFSFEKEYPKNPRQEPEELQCYVRAS